jgi:uncharacterized protein YeaO (DUF488 family)
MSTGARLQRAYDEPGPDDGYRVLVDRVWPRGRPKAQLRLNEWANGCRPQHRAASLVRARSGALGGVRDALPPGAGRSWSGAAFGGLAERVRLAAVTLVFGTRDPAHNQARAIADELARRAPGGGSSATAGA